MLSHSDFFKRLRQSEGWALEEVTLGNAHELDTSAAVSRPAVPVCVLAANLSATLEYDHSGFKRLEQKRWVSTYVASGSEYQVSESRQFFHAR